MPISEAFPRVSMATARSCMLAALEANQPAMLIGDPGVGKSALARDISKELGTALSVLIGSTLDPTDVGGIPVVRADAKGIDRIPLEVIRRVCERPGILFIDEVGTAAPAVQAALLRGILERVFGDCELHPESRVFAATNPPEQSPGGSELSAPLIGRLMVLHLVPTFEEVVDFFAELGAEGSALRAEAVDFSVTARVAPDLLQISIPQEAITGNTPWGAPRAWERVCRARAVLPPAKPGDAAAASVLRAVTAGSVGLPQATAYAAIHELRKHLPSVSDILADPEGTHIPDDRKLQIGAVGLIARVAERDKWAGYIYANRLVPELRAACGKLLGKRAGGTGPEENDQSPYRKKGALARLDILKSIPRSTATR